MVKRREEEQDNEYRNFVFGIVDRVRRGQKQASAENVNKLLRKCQTIIIERMAWR